jgi:hypothetical protein
VHADGDCYEGEWKDDKGSVLCPIASWGVRYLLP